MSFTNAIPEKQNQPQQLERLGAFSQLYLQAKRLLSLNMVLSVPLAIVWAFVVAAIPGLAVYAALWGIAVALLGSFYLTPTQKHLQTQAAKVQQLLDCDLFELDWQDFHNIGSPPPPETIFAANREYQKRHNYDQLKDWYPPEIGKLPLPLARLVCQRTNCWWDADLRRRYASWVITILAVLSVVVLLIGFIGGLPIEKFFLAVVAPLFPALVLGITQYREHMQAATTLDALRDKAMDIWSRALRSHETPETLYEYSIQLQAAIFNNRSKSPLIFNWFYQRLRDQNQESMNRGAKDLVAEAKQSLGWAD